jgi:xanthine dehydrogenase YagT iron-sulfur-binding subunit
MSNRQEPAPSGFTRRTFLQGMGAGALAAGAGVLGPKIANGAPQDAVKPALCGPDPVPVTLELNGKKVTLPLEPRVTLLDALRTTST